MNLMRLLMIIALSFVGRAHADTMGLLLCTQEAATFVSEKPQGAPRLVVVRDEAAWQTAWTATGQPGKPPGIDWNEQMVVGIVNGRKDDRVVYRIELDSAGSPTALVARVSTSDAPCGTQRTRARARAQLVVTARSALPVRFVEDVMIDGRLYVQNPSSEGVESHEIGTVQGTAAERKTREAAERLVIAALTPAQKKQLRMGPLGRSLGRIPHGWTRVHVMPGANGWAVDYDDLHFTVDLANGTAVLKP